MTRFVILVRVPIGWDTTDLIYRTKRNAEMDMARLQSLYPENEYEVWPLDTSWIRKDIDK